MKTEQRTTKKNTEHSQHDSSGATGVRLPDIRLELLSDKIRKGESVGIMESLEAIEYQEILKEKRKNSLWERIKHWWKWSA